jgi:hypothetical protein
MRDQRFLEPPFRLGNGSIGPVKPLREIAGQFRQLLTAADRPSVERDCRAIITSAGEDVAFHHQREGILSVGGKNSVERAKAVPGIAASLTGLRIEQPSLRRRVG